MSLSVRRQVKTVVQSFLFPEEFFLFLLFATRRNVKGVEERLVLMNV